MADQQGARWTSPERLQAQWAEHRRMEAVVAAVKRGQTGVTLPPYEPPTDRPERAQGLAEQECPAVEEIEYHFCDRRRSLMHRSPLAECA